MKSLRDAMDHTTRLTAMVVFLLIGSTAFSLAYCEGGFRERAISDVHLLLAGEQWRPQQETGLSAGPETVLQP